MPPLDSKQDFYSWQAASEQILAGNVLRQIDLKGKLFKLNQSLETS